MFLVERIKWVLIRRLALKMLKKNIRSHWTTYVDARSFFEGDNFIGPRCVLANCSVGAYSYFASRTRVHDATIGRFCSIGQEVQIGGLARQPVDRLSTHPCFYAENTVIGHTFHIGKTVIEERKSVQLGSDVWIGARAMILDGVRVGDGAVIGAGALVTKDVPAFAIVGGIPARIIRFRFKEETRQKILREPWWNASINHIKEMVAANEFAHKIL